jgi:hypothetical protein
MRAGSGISFALDLALMSSHVHAIETMAVFAQLPSYSNYLASLESLPLFMNSSRVAMHTIRVRRVLEFL